MLRLYLVACAVIALSCLGIWYLNAPVSFRHAFLGAPSQEEMTANMVKVGEQMHREAQDRLLDAQVENVRLLHGESASGLYKMCHTYPPTTKENKLRCQRSDEQFARDTAEAAKHPW